MDTRYLAKTTPWDAIDSRGRWIRWQAGSGANKTLSRRFGSPTVQLWRVLPTVTIGAEDPDKVFEAGDNLERFLRALGATSNDRGTGSAVTAKLRKFHVLVINWLEHSAPPPETPEPLYPHIAEVTGDDLVPNRLLAVGVELWPDTSSVLAKALSAPTLFGKVRQLTEAVLGERSLDMKPFERDTELVEHLMAQHDMELPNDEQIRQMQSWFNGGRGTAVEMQNTKDAVIIDGDHLQFWNVVRFAEPKMPAPGNEFGMRFFEDAQACVFSVTGELSPARIVGKGLRTTQRRSIAAAAEELALDPIERPDIENKIRLASDLEAELTKDPGRPVVTNASIVLGRRTQPGETRTGFDLLKDMGVECAPLEYRHQGALQECWPTSSVRVNPISHAFFPSVITRAGLNAFTQLGDPYGVIVGSAADTGAPVYTHPILANDLSYPPMTLIVGDSGSGKSYLLQSLVAQAVIGKFPTILVDPKRQSNMGPLVEFVGGQVASISSLQRKDGYFDFFRVVDPARHDDIAELFAAQVGAVLESVKPGDGLLTPPDMLLVRRVFQEAARRGARCGWDLVNALPAGDPEREGRARNLIVGTLNVDTRFALAFARTPISVHEMSRWDEGLLLLDIDGQLKLPELGAARSELGTLERSSVALIQLVAETSVEMLERCRGGVMALDEGWVWLSTDSGKRFVEASGRLGRSQNVWPLIATQRVTDITDAKLESYVTRVFGSRLKDEREALALLELFKYETTGPVAEARVKWLATEAGATHNGKIRPARMLMNDLYGRKGELIVDRIPPRVHTAITSRPSEVASRTGVDLYPQWRTGLRK